MLVVFYHVPKWNAVLDIPVVNHGHFMVELFFVLSGYVIFSNYAERIDSPRDLLKFQFLRFGRLYPVHIVFLLFFLGIEIAKYIAQMKLGITSPNTQPFRENSMEALIQQVLLIQAIGPTGNGTTFNGPAWSISVEFYTYLIFGFGVLLFGRMAGRVLFPLLAIGSLYLLHTEFAQGFDYLLRCICGFSIGCVTAVATHRTSIHLPTIAPILVAALAVSFLWYDGAERFPNAIYFLAAGLVISLVLSADGSFKRLLRQRRLVTLGAISYSVYMSHEAIIWAANQFVRVVLKRPEAIGKGGKSIPQLSADEALLAVLVITMLVIGTSLLVYKLIEDPLRESSRRFAARRLGPR